MRRCPRTSTLDFAPLSSNLIAGAITAGRIRSYIAADELLGAIARLSMREAVEPGQPQRMVALLADGLRSGSHG